MAFRPGGPWESFGMVLIIYRFSTFGKEKFNAFPGRNAKTPPGATAPGSERSAQAYTLNSLGATLYNSPAPTEVSTASGSI